MGETNRVKRWREAKRERGLKAVTIWLTTEEDLRLKDMALQRHCSPSEFVRQALAQFQPADSRHIGNVPDTELIRELIREELMAIQAPSVTVGIAVGDTVGDTVGPTDTHAPEPTAKPLPIPGYEIRRGQSVTPTPPASPQPDLDPT